MEANERVRQVVECRVCGKNDWREVVDFGPMPLANGFVDPEDTSAEPRFDLGLMSCRSCRLLSLTQVVDPELLYRDYSYVTSDSGMMAAHLRWVTKTCRDRFDLPPDSLVVELGSNIGTQLAEFAAAGLRVLGVDPARNLARVANARGIETLPEFFDGETARQIARGYGKARLILGRHVFAHIDDVAAMLAATRSLLDLDGVLAIEVPYAMDMLERYEFDTIYHEHLSYFAISPLVTLFQRNGMRLVDVERLAVHGGSILLFATLAESPRPVRPSVCALLDLEESAGLHGDRIYRDFANHVQMIRTDLSDLVHRLRADGERIAGYGASAKGNVILNACGLGRNELEFCSDTTDLKQGRLLPGTRVPVRSPEYARAHQPDYYLLLAWNYRDEILRAERAFIAGGGRFIVPVPTPTIVPIES